jgi:uncharacterized protein (TIGR02266 family)
MLRLVLLEPDLRAMISRERIFQHRTGCQVVLAQDADEFVRLAKQGRPHLLVADADLLGEDLERTLAQLKRTTSLKGTPIVVTAARRASADDRLTKAGADAVLAKPVGKQRFFELVRAAVSALDLEVRVPASVEVTYTVGARERTGRVTNLSKGGLFLEAEHLAEIGSKLTIVLALPAFTNSVQVNGVVTWVNDGQTARSTQLPKGMGLKFVETPLVALKTVALFVMLSKDVLRIT